MSERAGWNRPDKIRGSLDILGKCALVRERSAMHETCDVRTNRERCHGLADRDYSTREVAPENGASSAYEVDVCKGG